MRMDLLLVVLAFHHVKGIDWSSSVRSNDFISYDFFADTVQAYRTETVPSVKRQKVVDGPVGPFMALANDGN